jgi:hypothetical protein
VTDDVDMLRRCRALTALWPRESADVARWVLLLVEDQVARRARHASRNAELRAAASLLSGDPWDRARALQAEAAAQQRTRRQPPAQSVAWHVRRALEADPGLPRRSLRTFHRAIEDA